MTTSRPANTTQADQNRVNAMEQERRDREAQALNFGKAYMLARFGRLNNWRAIDDPSKSPPTINSSMAAISTGMPHQKEILKPGVYAYEPNGIDDKSPYKDFLLDYDGRTVTPTPPPVSEAARKAAFSMAMDFLASQGASAQIIDIGSAGGERNYYADKERLKTIKIMMAAAESKGLSVEFGPNIKRFIATAAVSKEQKEQLYEDLNRIRLNQSRNEFLKKVGSADFFYDQAAELNKKKAWDYTQQAFQLYNSANANDLTSQLSIAEQEINSVKQRLDEAVRVQNHLHNSLHYQTELLTNNDELSKLFVGERVGKELLGSDETHMESPQRVINHVKSNEKALDAAFVALNKEISELKVRQDAWKDEVAKLNTSAATTADKALIEKAKAIDDTFKAINAEFDQNFVTDPVNVNAQPSKTDQIQTYMTDFDKHVQTAQNQYDTGQLVVPKPGSK